jgi:RimJ/RimL family protein N-acetyltransferase
MVIRTPRLTLRRWLPADLEPLARLNADAEVMRHFPATLNRGESDALAATAQAHIDEHGFGPMAIEREGEFIGFAGLYRTTFAPWIEILWRIAKDHHNRGYATEAARAILDDGFGRLRLDEIVAFTVPHNLPSRRVMEKLGMRFDGEFEHPELPPGHPLRKHVLYRMR